MALNVFSSMLFDMPFCVNFSRSLVGVSWQSAETKLSKSAKARAASEEGEERSMLYNGSNSRQTTALSIAEARKAAQLCLLVDLSPKPQDLVESCASDQSSGSSDVHRKDSKQSRTAWSYSWRAVA